MSESISTPQKSIQLSPDFALDESLYDLTEEERTFFKQQTGIPDDDDLKAHIFRLQAEAYEVYPYACIRLFHFARFKILRLFRSSYQNLLEIGKSRKGAIFLDIGCCMGTDARKLIADGYPLEQVVTSDLRQEFANLGHKLFKTTQETCPIAFVPGDVFDPNHLEIAPPMASAQASTGDPPLSGSAPDLRSLTSLNSLHGRVFAIHASAFFHLFDEEKQLHLARALAGLLSPEPGSKIFGRHIGAPEKKGFEPSIMRRDHRLWCHSPESWTELWDGLVFEKGVVKVQTKLVHRERRNLQPDAPQNAMITLLVWSVTRL
ncbi:hypothetical protein F5888DRAFT_1928794 [Russula emetica]|nr:hypothetical protein F5888DRAFT_1928794 [Russula emetica]